MRGRGLAAVGAGVLFLFAAVGLLAPLLAPHDPRALSGDALEAPSGRHLLGTNDIGRTWPRRSSGGPGRP